MEMPGRSYVAGNQYRYGFNGKESDTEIKGEGTQYDYGFRIYDSRLGKFLSVDPLRKKYPELSPYQYASNRPIDGIDVDGLEWLPPMKTGPDGKQIVDGDAAIKVHTHRNNAIAVAVALDVVIFKGWLTRTLIASEGLGTLHHNKPTSPEESKERARQMLQAARDMGAGFVLGEMITIGRSLFTEGKSILKTTYTHGDVKVSTQVGKESVNLGSGGIGTGGYIELDINVKVGSNGQRVASGETVFEEIFKTASVNANQSINGIRGRWYSGDNLNQFNKLITEKVNKGLMTVEEAAKQTFTGRMAAKKGFTNVHSIAGQKNTDGTYKFVTSIIFGK